MQQGLTADLRRPVLVGGGQLRANRARTVQGAREPLPLLVEALRRAAAPELLARTDTVCSTHVASWAYDGLAARLAAEVGATPRHVEDAGLGGHTPVRLLDAMAARIWSGESDVALLVGGEAQASVSLLRKAGVDPVAQLGWSATPGGPPAFDLDQLGAPAMQEAGLLAPTRVYPLYDNRLQADLGLTRADSAAWSATMYAALSRVAAGHPAAWDTAERTVEQVRDVAAGNRMVCEPYPLLVNAMPHVDQAAAVVLTSLGAARAAGVPEDQLVHVWGGAGADDDSDVLRRPDLGRSPSLEQALDRALAATGTAVADLDLVDVYSCFPVVPKLVGLHLGLPRDTVLSATGGHASFGGPLNSYSLHALVTVADRLRERTGTALVHANGGYLTYQHVVLLSSRPHAEGYVGRPAPVAVAGDRVRVRPLPADGADVDVVVETATVEHDRTGGPRQAFVVGRTTDGDRVAASTPAGDADAAAVLSLDRVPAGTETHVGRRVRLAPDGRGTCAVRPLEHQERT